jgi:NAD-reducing hydrogenase small subunit
MNSVKPTLATVWLDGCSGCHMSFLDMDERLLALAEQAELVYSPLVDRKDFPEHVDITLVEGSISSEEDLAKIIKVRAHTGTLVSLGDCAVTSNIPGMRNAFGAQAVLDRAYVDTVSMKRPAPSQVIPLLLERVRPIHEVVEVDVFVPGCPPSAEIIFETLQNLLSGRSAHHGRSVPRFGA